MISIGNASLRAEIDPQRGGSVTRLDALSPGGVAPILRPAAPEFARSGDPTQAAAFVTAPYFGPIGGGRLTLAGATYAILHNHPDEPEPIHGDAWLRPWAVLAQEPETVTLGYTHVPVPGCFPLPYQVTQTLTLGDACLTVGL